MKMSRNSDTFARNKLGIEGSDEDCVQQSKWAEQLELAMEVNKTVQAWKKKVRE